MIKWILTAALIFLASPSNAAAQSKDAADDPFAAALYIQHFAQGPHPGATGRGPTRRPVPRSRRRCASATTRGSGEDDTRDGPASTRNRCYAGNGREAHAIG